MRALLRTIGVVGRRPVDELAAKTFVERIGGYVPSNGRRMAFLQSTECTIEDADAIVRRCDGAMAAAEDYVWAGSIHNWSDQQRTEKSEVFVAQFSRIDSEA